MALKDLITRIRITAKDETSAVFSSLQKRVAGVAVAIAGFFTTKFFAGSVQEAEKLDVQMRKLRATIESTGGAAGLTAEEIDKLARDLDEATLGSAEGFRKAANSLLTFKSIGRDSFGTVLELAADLEAAGFGTLETNAVQLGKALEDPIKGLTALTRSGVTFTDEQQKVIKALVATGRAAEAQGIILEAVQGQVGGVARAAGTGLSGAMDLVKKRLTDLRQQLGEAILPVFQRFNERIAETYKRLSESGVIKRFGEVLATAFDAAQEAVFRFIDSFDLEPLVRKVSDFAGSTRDAMQEWSQRLESAGRVSRVVFGAIGTGLETIKAAFFGVSGVVAKWAELTTRAYAKVADGLALFSSRFEGVGDEMRNVAESFGESSRQNFERASKALDEATESGRRLRESLADLAGVSDAATGAVDQVGAAAQDLAKKTQLTADELDSLGEGFEFVDGQARKAAAGIDAAGNAGVAGAGGLAEATAAALRLDEAYKTLGVTSQGSLDNAALDAQIAFNLISESGKATTRDIALAFQAYAEKAIAANNGVADSALKAQAATLGMKIEKDDGTDKVVEKLTAAQLATRAVGEEAEKSADAVRRIGDEAEIAARKIEQMAAASRRPFGGESGFKVAADDFGSSVWGGASRVGGTTGALERELRAAATAAGSRR